MFSNDFFRFFFSLFFSLIFKPMSKCYANIVEAFFLPPIFHFDSLQIPDFDVDDIDLNDLSLDD